MKETTPETRRFGRLPEVLLVCATLVLVPILMEAALRLAGKDEPPPYPPKNLRPGVIEAYEPYGYRMIPSLRTTYPYPHNSPHPRTVSLVANRDGFRDSRELDEPDPRPRILFLGDSFLFGDGVEESERFTNVLEKMEPTWRMDNLGIVGYGPDLMLRSLEVVGLKTHPAVVVFCMTTDSFRRVRPEFAGTGFTIPRYELHDGHLVTVPYPAPTFWNQLRITVAINKILWDRMSWQWDLDEAILNRFEELGDQHSFKKALVFLPGTDDTPLDQKRRAWLKQYAGRHSTPYVDLSDPLHKMGRQAFIPDDPHLNEAGHMVVARELDRFLNAGGLLTR